MALYCLLRRHKVLLCSHTDGGSAVEHWRQPIITRNSVGFNVLPKDILTPNLWFSNQRSTTPFHHQDGQMKSDRWWGKKKNIKNVTLCFLFFAFFFRKVTAGGFSVNIMMVSRIINNIKLKLGFYALIYECFKCMIVNMQGSTVTMLIFHFSKLPSIRTSFLYLQCS